MNELQLKSKKRLTYNRILRLTKQIHLIEAILSPLKSELSEKRQLYTQLDEQLAEIDGRKKVITAEDIATETRIKNYIKGLSPSEVKALADRLSSVEAVH